MRSARFERSPVATSGWEGNVVRRPLYTPQLSSHSWLSEEFPSHSPERSVIFFRSEPSENRATFWQKYLVGAMLLSSSMFKCLSIFRLESV